jgi:hypothetical protein
MKTYEDYLNDPALAGEPRALREVHAMRLKVQDEIRGMTAAEQTAYFHEAVILDCTVTHAEPVL